jgi:hypothetical protein
MDSEARAMINIAKTAFVILVLIMNLSSTAEAGSSESPQEKGQAAITKSVIKRIRDEVTLYAKKRGETELEFAQRVNSSPENVEATVFAFEQGGRTAEDALGTLERLSAALKMPNNAPSPSSQIELPRYDVEKYCTKHATDVVNSWSGAGYRFDKGEFQADIENARNSCINNEQSSYDYLKSIWTELSDQSKMYCLQWADNNNLQIYSSLSICMEPRFNFEQETKDQPPFHY